MPTGWVREAVYDGVKLETACQGGARGGRSSGGKFDQGWRSVWAHGVKG